VKSNFKPLGAILQNIVQKHHIEDEYRFQKLQQDWNNLVDPQIAKISEPLSLDGKILTIKVQSAEWQEEIKKYSKEIIKIINNKLENFELEYINIK